MQFDAMVRLGGNPEGHFWQIHTKNQLQFVFEIETIFDSCPVSSFAFVTG